MDSFTNSQFSLYNTQAPSFSNGINQGFFVLPNATAAGIPTGNSFPYVFTFVPGVELLQTTLTDAGNYYLPLDNILESTSVRKVRGNAEFYGIQFDYPRSLVITTTEAADFSISYVDVNNYKTSYQFTSGDAPVELPFGINILNNILVTTTDPSNEITIELGNRYELPYVDYYVPNSVKSVAGTPSFGIEMVAIENSTDEVGTLKSCLLIQTQTNIDPYPMGIAPLSILNSFYQFTRPLLNFEDLKTTIPSGSPVVIWQTVFPAYSLDVRNKVQNGELLDLEGQYQTGEAVFGTVPETTNWIGWNG